MTRVLAFTLAVLATAALIWIAVELHASQSQPTSAPSCTGFGCGHGVFAD